MTVAWHEDARELHAQGLNMAEIGRRLGYTKTAVRKALNPDPERVRLDNQRRRETKQAWAREHYRGRCEVCGALTTRRGTTRCNEHRLDIERAEARRVEIQRRWLAGESMIEIADALGTTVNVLGTDMHRMRAAGWDLPHRLKRKGAA